MAFRIAGAGSRPGNLYFLLNPELNYPAFFKKDHRLFWKLKPNQVIKSDFMVEGEYRINSYGFRDKEFPFKKKPGVYRIVCLGNSNVFGWKQPEEFAYPPQLQKLFDRDQKEFRVEVINAGITGYSSYQGKIFLEEEILRLKPDLVTVNYGWNDLLPARFGVEDKRQEFPPEWALAIQNSLSNLRLYAALKSLWVGRFAQKEQTQKGVKRVAMDDFGNNLKEIESLCRQNGIEVLILTLPVASIKAHWGPGKTSVPHLLNQAYNNAIRQLAVAENYRALDIAALFYDRADLYDDAHNDYIHYNARGHQLVARVIFDYITAAGFLSRTAYAGQ